MIIEKNINNHYFHITPQIIMIENNKIFYINYILF